MTAPSADLAATRRSKDRMLKAKKGAGEILLSPVPLPYSERKVSTGLTWAARIDW